MVSILMQKYGIVGGRIGQKSHKFNFLNKKTRCCLFYPASEEGVSSSSFARSFSTSSSEAVSFALQTVISSDARRIFFA